uniref:U4/U6 snRNA-associated-splicing factor PRP24 n=1 Tax=Kwoniella dejecticola CBS 10117 TaxID=1296121 RepID=A0A1A6A2K1_9TREE|nr:uncharacterized protein I303_05135 [Kwoniella dejecticola CBS 10117]OBR84278.1 hypothetical protein I303_05135 [Kwoniella dejecticola CBS 10117]
MAELEASSEVLLAELNEVLAAQEVKPHHVPLIRRQISLMIRLGMTEEVLNGYSRLSYLVMLDENTWLSYFDLKLASYARPFTLDAFVEVLEKFDQAEQDYLYGDVIDFLTEDNTRNMVKSVYQRGSHVLNESDQLWQTWLGWELGLLGRASNKGESLDVLHAIYIDRMRTPHTSLDQTSSAYSSFCSQHCPEEYEVRMIEATEASKIAKDQLSEKRYGRTRNDFEEQLRYTADPNARVQILLEYAHWESDPRARTKSSGQGPHLDQRSTQSVYERAVCSYAKAVAILSATLDESENSVRLLDRQLQEQSKQKKEETHVEREIMRQQMELNGEAVRAYKDAESVTWRKYGSWAVETLPPEAAGQVWSRAVRACPQNGDVWVDYLLNEVTTSAAYERSLALGMLDMPGNRVTDLVTVFCGRAAMENRLIPSENVEGGFGTPVMATVLRGLDQVATVDKSGDSGLRLEKFLLSWAETRAPAYLEQALLVVDKPNKARSSAYQMVLLHADTLSRHGEIERARDVFHKALERSDLDWPEAVHEALLRFECVHGKLDSLLDAQKRIDRQMEKVIKRREKAAIHTQQQQKEPATAVSDTHLDDTLQTAANDARNEVVAEGPTASGDQEPAYKRSVYSPIFLRCQQFSVKQSCLLGLVRDREHTTILVSGLPNGISRERIESLFTDCGPIRETTIISDGHNDLLDAALVEFSSVEAVPSALQKDRRKVDGHEASISMLWRSTLFVTNFSQEIDDATLRQLFSQYGRILQTRWPSRKYASNRRFCYITMESPSAAQEALILHGYKTGNDGFGMSVLISDPSAKTQRSDASNSTLFVGGLDSKTTEVDVRSLLQGRGTIRNVKLGWDPLKRICKGFAFVDMASEAEARACLQLDGTPFLKKKLKVQISDPNFANKKAKDRKPDQLVERRDRLVTLTNLPENTQEGLLQQALEKVVGVRRLELFTKVNEAVAELESAQDVGKLLLGSEPFVFQGNEIHFTDRRNRAPPITKASTETITTTSFAPRAARKAKVIAKPRPTAVAAATSKAEPGATTQGQEDFRALVAAKNKQREEKLNTAKESATGEKRKSELDEQDDVKRART